MIWRRTAVPAAWIAQKLVIGVSTRAAKLLPEILGRGGAQIGKEPKHANGSCTKRQKTLPDPFWPAIITRKRAAAIAFRKLVRLDSGGNGTVIWGPPSPSCALALDAAGGPLSRPRQPPRALRGISGTIASSETVAEGGGSLVGLTYSGDILTRAYSATTPQIIQTSPSDKSFAVDGYLAGGMGLRLGDGTVVGSAADIAALGPVQGEKGGGMGGQPLNID